MLAVPLLSVMAAGPWLLTLSTDTSSTTCAARRVLDGTLRQVPRVETRWAEGEASADATYAGRAWTVTIAGRTGRDADVVQALREAWPTDRPPLPRALHPPPYDLLLMACAGRVDAAYAAAGAAVPLALARWAGPSKAPASLLGRWAYGRRQLAAGRLKAALPHLEAVHRALATGALAPVWRAAVGFDRAPQITLLGDRVALFEDGTFEVHDLSTGARLWARTVPSAEPRPIPVEGDRLLLVLDDAVEAVDASTGETRWRFALRAPQAEVEARLGLVYVAGAEAVTALRATDGQPAWTYDGLSAPVAGPVSAGGELAVPLSGKIAVLDPIDGREVATIALDDEVSGPLVVTPQGGLWALLGSDEVVHVPPGRRGVDTRVSNLPGVFWPPAILGEALMLANGSSRRAALVRVDPRTGATRPRGRPVRAPLVPLRDYSGVVHAAPDGRALTARSPAGRVLWTARPPGPIDDWTVVDDFVVTAAGRSVELFDHRTGQRTHTVRLPRPVRGLAFGPNGGVVVVAGGTMYGVPLPADPRWRWWQRDARMIIAKAFMRAERLEDARRALRGAVQAGTRDLEAMSLLAETETRLGRPEAVGAWLEVLAAIPADDARRARGLADVKRIAGLLEVVDAGAHRIRANEEWLVVEKREGGIEGRRLAAPHQVEWAQALGGLRAIRGGHVRIGERWHRLSDGAPDLPAGVAALADGLQLHGRDRQVIRAPQGDDPGWTKPAPDGVTSAEVLGDHLILFGPRAAALWSARTGQQRWFRRRRAETKRGAVGEQVVVLRTETGLHVLRADSGAQLHRLAIASSSQVIVEGDQAIIAEDRTLRFVDLAQGRLDGTLELPSAVREMTSAGGSLFLALEGGQLVAVDPRRRRRRAGVAIRARDLAAAGDQLAVADDRGRLLIFDAKRGLGAR